MENSGKTPRRIMVGSRYHIVIVGANFAGLKAAMALPSKFKVTVIDPGTHFEFLPNIHELVSGVKKASDLRIDRRRLVPSVGHRFIQDTVELIDTDRDEIRTVKGKRIGYDFCLLAIGGVSAALDSSGAETFSMPFKSVEDCLSIGKKLRSLLLDKSNKANVAIIGAGLEGIEALGEILRRYGGHPGLKVDVIEKKSRVLASTPSGLDREIKKLCGPYPVTFHMNESITGITHDSVSLSSGQTIPADIVIRTGGVAAPPLLFHSNLCEKPDQWAPVFSTLRSKFSENVFIAGDAADFPEPMIKQAYHALDMGEAAAGNIRKVVEGEPLEKYQPAARPLVVAFGNLSTFLVTHKSAISGTVLAGVKEAIYQITMASLNKPVKISSVFDLAFRAKASLTGHILPTLASFSALKRLPDIKLITSEE